VKGWFRDTLPKLVANRFALIRLDGDMYESTHVALQHLYPCPSPGGFAIVDDYGAVEARRCAVTDYRIVHGVAAPLHKIDWTGVYWRKPSRTHIRSRVCPLSSRLPENLPAFKNPVRRAYLDWERDDLDPAPIEFLWLRHVLGAETASRSCRPVWTSYDRLLQS